MRIGHYATDLTARGGIASYVRRTGRAQRARGHEVFYLSRQTDEDSSRPLVGVENDRGLFLRAHSLDLDVLHLHRPVDALPEDRVPTVRTMHGNHGSCPSASRYLKRTGQPCNRAFSVGGCLWGHLVDHCGSRRPQNIAENFETFRRIREQASTLPTLTVSRFLKEQMIRSGCEPNNLHVLHSPAPDVDRSYSPPPQEGTPHFVFAGRIEPKKGVDWLLRSIAELDVDVHLDVAGSGNREYMDRLDRLVADLGVGDRVTFHGWLDQPDVYTLIEQSRGLVFPSVWHEPAGLVTLEAAALGRPVIASDVGGIPEYATDDFALLVSPRDVEALSSRIECLALNPNHAEELGRHGRSAARSRFCMTDFLDRLHRVYRRIQPHDATSTATIGSRRSLAA